MTKLDVLMTFLGLASYIAIMVDMRNQELKAKNFELNQEKRRVYLQHMEHKRKDDVARSKAIERKMAAKAKLNQASGTMERLGASDI